jgi:hypothetical protein
MAKTISQLPDATVVNGSDELIIQQSGVTKRATKTEVLAGIVNANIATGAAIVGTKIAPDFGSGIVKTNSSLEVFQSAATDGAVVDGLNTANRGIWAWLGNISSGGGINIGQQVSSSKPPELNFYKSRGGNTATPTVVSDNDGVGEINFRAFDGTGWIDAAAIAAGVDGTPGTDDMPGRLIFSTTADGGSSPIERMRITNAGNVGIANTSPQAPLDIFGGGNTLRFTGTGASTTGGISFFNSTEQRAEIGVGGGSGAITINSDPNNAAASSNIRLLVDGAEAMRIDSAGNVGIGTTLPNDAAALTLTSTTKGFLPPRMTTAQRDAISTPPAGLMIYNTSTNKLNVRTASSWEAVTSA